jgi:hypothetical protein
VKKRGRGWKSLRGEKNSKRKKGLVRLFKTPLRIFVKRQPSKRFKKE